MSAGVRRGLALHHPLAPALVAGTAGLLAGLLVMTPWMVGAFYDDGTYLVLAKSLASGHGYRYLNLPGAPEATHFPPGYPAFLALFLRLAPDFGIGVALAKLANAMLLGVVALGAYLLGRRTLGWSAWAAAAVAVVGVTAPALLAMNAMLMSESLFLAVLLPTLVCAERLVREEGRTRDAVSVGVLVGVLQLVRSIGLPVLGAVLFMLVLRRRWKAAAAVLVAAIAVTGPWLAWVATHGGHMSPGLIGVFGAYGDWLDQSAAGRRWEFLGQVVVHNVPLHLSYLGARFTPVPGALAAAAALGCVLVLVIASVAELRRRAPVTLLFLAGYVALVLSWPYTPDRFYYAVEPLLAILVASGAVAGWRMLRGGGARARMAVGGVVATAALVAGGGQLRQAIDGLRRHRSDYYQRSVHEALLPVVAWASASTPPSAVIATDLAPLVYLYADRSTIPLVNFRAADHLRAPTSASPSLLGDTRALLTSFHPDYLIVRSDLVRDALRATLPTLPVRVALLGTLPQGSTVLRLQWTAATRTSSR